MPTVIYYESWSEITGQAMPVLLILQVLGAAKHLVLHRDGVFMRMIKPIAGGH